ncbi:hypothetical protein WN48_00294 [Eufriesea mexicana]|uniref:Uncharacterized protein n=1 Tax=Eufriesea mexicana TaxID=516756 RepID=A0A310S5J7_9HYME|nr:hypothetical protein WN48_00294 [Eufriesea mexicana]
MTDEPVPRCCSTADTDHEQPRLSSCASAKGFPFLYVNDRNEKGSSSSPTFTAKPSKLAKYICSTNEEREG